MASQNYKNHIRFYTPHHFIFYPVLLVLLIFSIYKAFTTVELQQVWAIIAILIFLIGWLSFMTRQHYALTLQNRIIRLEMRHKYFVLTGKDFEPLEQQLTFGQIAALRFASDHELVLLIEKTLKDTLAPDIIKKEIAQWNADHMRV